MCRQKALSLLVCMHTRGCSSISLPTHPPIQHNQHNSNTSLPMARSIRLAQEGFVVFGLDPEGHGRSDGLHVFIPSFPAVIDDYWAFFEARVRDHPEHKGLPVFLLGESMGGNVAIQLLLRDRTEGTNYFKGAVMLAPMVKINPKIKPPECIVNLLRHIAPLVPTLPVAPTKDVLAQAFRRPEILHLARNSPYAYRLKPRLGTALSLIEATEEVARRMEEVKHPFLILQGGGDVVTSPELAQEFHDRASSQDKEFKLYDGLWHSLVAGELKENVDLVYADIFAWLERQLGTGDETKEQEERGGGGGQGTGGARRRNAPRTVKIK